MSSRDLGGMLGPSLWTSSKCSMNYETLVQLHIPTYNCTCWVNVHTVDDMFVVVYLIT